MGGPHRGDEHGSGRAEPEGDAADGDREGVGVDDIVGGAPDRGAGQIAQHRQVRGSIRRGRPAWKKACPGGVGLPTLSLPEERHPLADRVGAAQQRDVVAAFDDGVGTGHFGGLVVTPAEQGDQTGVG